MRHSKERKTVLVVPEMLVQRICSWHEFEIISSMRNQVRVVLLEDVSKDQNDGLIRYLGECASRNTPRS